MEPDFLRKILNRDKIALLLDSRRPADISQAGSQAALPEPATLQGKWPELLALWQSAARDLFEDDGKTPDGQIDRKHPYDIKNNPHLQAVMTEIFRGYMRVFVRREEAIQTYTETAWSPMSRGRSPAPTDMDIARVTEQNANYDVALYTQLAGEYLQMEGKLPKEHVRNVMGGIITRAAGVYKDCFGKPVHVPKTALLHPELSSPGDERSRKR